MNLKNLGARLSVLLLSTAALFLPAISHGQASACPAVNAGVDATICAGNCTNLTATVQGSVGTSTYSVGPVAYNPYSYTTGTQVLVNIDDVWTSAIPMPFCFDFFGNTYNNIVIGSNGILSFDLADASAFCAWQITAAAPSTSSYDAVIMAPYQDIDPSIGSSSDVRYQVYGTAPCREFVVSWYHVPMYSTACNSLLASSQIVLHETTNIIDIYIENKPLCPSWNSGAGIEGIVSPGYSSAYIVPGRNYPTQWTAVNDGQRFIPTGSPNYTVSWDGPSGNIGNTNTVTVCPTTTTTYTATVTNSSCAGPIVVSDQVVVNVTNNLSSTSSSTAISSCNATDGTATATPSGGSGTYTYSWNPSGQTTQTATGLPAGTYTCTITDVNGGCQTTAVVTVPGGAGVTSTPASTATSCSGGSNGTASVNASGGSGIYTYNWNPSGQTTQTATGLPAGTYTCTITDSNGCTTTQQVTVTQPPAITTIASSTGTSCNGGSDGTASVSASGGTGAYTYTWTPNVSSTASATNLAAGTYSCTVTDANGCTATESFTITQPTAVTASSSGTNVSCNGGNNGTATVSPSGGTGTYTYSWAPAGGTGATANGLPAGTYTCTITDSNGCTGTASYTITQPTVLTTSVSTVNAGCPANGSATATPSGGTGPYTYSWSSGGTAATEGNLPAGTYTVTVTDANGCTDVQTATIQNSPAVTATSTQTNVSCFGGQNGSATVNASGGSGTYNYSWAPSGGSTATANGLPAGTYTCTITDSNGCTTTQSVTITQPTQITATASSTPVSCNGGGNGTATVNASGGTGGFTYNWAPSGGSMQTATTLIAGTYTVTVTDANGCVSTQTVTVTQPAALLATATGNSACAGNPATLNVTSTGGTGPFTYSWSNGATTASQTLTIAQTTTYSVTVTDANGCQNSATATITVNPQPVATITTNANNGMIQLSGGTAEICFDGPSNVAGWAWNLNGTDTSLQQSPCVIVTDSGQYCATLIVASSQGCLDTANVCLEIINSYYSIPNVFTPNADGTNDVFMITNEGMKSLHCEIFDRWGRLVYEWDGTTGSWDGNDRDGNPCSDGVYYFTVKLEDFGTKVYDEHGFVHLIKGK